MNPYYQSSNVTYGGNIPPPENFPKNPPPPYSYLPQPGMYPQQPGSLVQTSSTYSVGTNGYPYPQTSSTYSVGTTGYPYPQTSSTYSVGTTGYPYPQTTPPYPGTNTVVYKEKPGGGMNAAHAAAALNLATGALLEAESHHHGHHGIFDHHHHGHHGIFGHHHHGHH